MLNQHKIDERVHALTLLLDTSMILGESNSFSECPFPDLESMSFEAQFV